MIDAPEAPSEIVYHYIKSNQFRVIHADGAWGGITPRGLLHASFFSERQPLPRQTVHSVEGDKVGAEIRDRRVSRDGPVREIEVGVTMDLGAAKSLHVWLGEKITELEAILKKVGARDE